MTDLLFPWLALVVLYAVVVGVVAVCVLAPGIVNRRRRRQ